LLWDWVRKKMNLDEQISKRIDKQMLNQPENVCNTVPTKIKILKGQFLLPFFFACCKNLQ
tara:strand:- start:945 stop:1124 length:180 start_codon:yes stop_codon:yes gene_type:complete